MKALVLAVTLMFAVSAAGVEDPRVAAAACGAAPGDTSTCTEWAEDGTLVRTYDYGAEMPGSFDLVIVNLYASPSDAISALNVPGDPMVLPLEGSGDPFQPSDRVSERIERLAPNAIAIIGGEAVISQQEMQGYFWASRDHTEEVWVERMYGDERIGTMLNAFDGGPPPSD